MKFNEEFFPSKKIWIKPFLIMKMIILLMTAFCIQASATGQKISMVKTNASLKEVFLSIEKQSGYLFIYESGTISADMKASVHLRNADIHEAVKESIEKFPLSFSIVGKNVLIKRSEKKAVPSVPIAVTEAIIPAERTVTGHVVDSVGSPIDGASVYLKTDERIGVVTNSTGRFALVVPSDAKTLVVKHVGYNTTEVELNNNTNYIVRLTAKQTKLEEFVIQGVSTGFYKKNQASFTGSAVTFTGEQLKSVAPSNVFQALSLLTPGMVMTENNQLGSNPNAIPEILVRGVTSFSNNDQSVNQPLIVRDGTIISVQALYDMDINEIQTITVLKDASATALYGARAANGVIVIERKKMASGKLKLIYNVIAGLQFPDFSGYDILNSRDKLEYEKLAGLYSSTDHVQQQRLDSLYNVRLMDVNRGVYTDWLAKPSRVGFSNDHSIRLNGGAGNTRYELNLRYGSVEGVMKDDSRKRYGLGFVLEHNTDNGFTFTNRTSLSQTAIKYSPYGSFSTYTKMNPYDRVYDAFGEVNKVLSWDVNNPLYEASLGSFSKAQTQNLSNDFDVRWKLNDRFTVTSHINFLLNGGSSDIYTSPLSGVFKDFTDPTKKGSLSLSNNKGLTYSGNLVFTYNEKLPKQSLLTANLGGNFNHTNNKFASFTGVGFYADALKSINFAASYPTGGAPGGSQDLNADVASFLNLNYMYNNRYYVDGVYQISGSSKFGANNRYSHFWSTGLGWNIHNESFMDNNWLNIFRLRGSAGYTGKVSFASYQALTTYRYDIALNYLNGIGAIPITIGNPDLKWERTMNYNAGIDLSLLQRRVNLTADFYIRKTTDLLIDKTIPPSAGITLGKANLGEIENKGFELRLDGYVIKQKDWQWQLGATATHNKNKILKISNALKAQNDLNNQLNTVSPLPQFQEGESTTAIKVVRSAGIDPATGKEVYIKLNGDRTFVYDPADKVVVGDFQPDMLGTVFSVLNYKRFSMAAYFSYYVNQYIYNTTRATKVEGSDPIYNADYRVFSDRWKKPGDIALYRDIADKSLPYQTTRFVEKENTFSLSRLNIAYDIEPQFLSKLRISKAAVGVSMNELFRLSTVKIERGTDYLFSRGVELNLNIIF
ncbi:MAG: SusC/RagA family TonB-linked outer membrane protein [Chitinophagaceae bacterium]|nr:MAG: SusC/RagA family TonB-linked outer membrane protein [Chitinophagaceae bacterium]